MGLRTEYVDARVEFRAVWSWDRGVERAEDAGVRSVRKRAIMVKECPGGGRPYIGGIFGELKFGS